MYNVMTFKQLDRHKHVVNNPQMVLVNVMYRSKFEHCHVASFSIISLLGIYAQRFVALFMFPQSQRFKINLEINLQV